MTADGHRIVSVSVTPAGRALAARLPYEHVHGGAAEAVRRLWPEVDGLVLMLATGAAVRIVAPLLEDKARDPGVVCVDEAGRWAVALAGGHAGGANRLARDVAALLGAQPVVTTATDATGVPALDSLPGFAASGDVAGVTAALLAGRRPIVEVELAGWPPPAALIRPEPRLGGTPGPERVGETPEPERVSETAGPERVVVTDRTRRAAAGVAFLHPPSLVVGVGCSSNAPPGELAELVAATLAAADLDARSVATIGTIDRRADHPAVRALGLPVRAWSAAELSAVPVPNPSEAVADAVGTPSVAEAAALLAAGPDAELVVVKHRSAAATVAVSRRARPAGRLTLVGLGPGDAAQRTPAAAAAVRAAEVVLGYDAYVRQAADLIGPGQAVESSPIGEEEARARRALELAAEGRAAVLVCSGDAGVYAMASLVHELSESVAPGVDLDVVPGVTAGLAAASLLGAPLGHDHAVVSLSDLLTPWEVIERRVRAAAEADLVLVLYNPRSAGRRWQLDAALDVLRRHRPPGTPVGVVTDAYRPGQQVSVSTLAEFDAETVGMTSCVIVGASTTRTIGGRMTTPRGYRPCP